MSHTVVKSSRLAALGALAVLMAGGSAQAVDVTGAGATFPNPVYQKWAEAYKAKTGNSVNYQSVGSGAGIKQIESNTVDFGATDKPLEQDELKKNDLVQFPAVICRVSRPASSSSTAPRSAASSWARSRPGTTRPSKSKIRA
jgi:phosphate transport system substrate-binding protein